MSFDLDTVITSAIKANEFINLDKLEELTVKEDQVDCPVVHRFSPGVYIREVFIPADTFAIGHRQRKEHLNIFLAGRVMMLNEDGTTSELVAPMIFTGKPGRKCGYISEDVVWLNVYPTDERDIETLEKMFLDKTPVVEDEVKHVNRTIDHEDFKKVIAEYGFDEKTVRLQSENLDDRIDFPYGGYSVIVSDSDIEGRGLFATANFKAGQDIAPGRIGKYRTPAGIYTNHSISNNAEFIRRNDDIIMVAVKDIHGMAGGFKGDEITVNYRDSLKLQLGGNKCLE